MAKYGGGCACGSVRYYEMILISCHTSVAELLSDWATWTDRVGCAPIEQ